MAGDEDAIYIDVVPRVDDSAADSAVEKLKDKFKDVANDVGPEFMDAMRNSGVLDDLGGKLAESISDALRDPLHDISDTIGVDLDSALEKALNKDWGGLSGVVGKGLGGKIAESLGLDNLGDEISDRLGVDINAALGKALNKDWGGLAGVVGKGLGGKLGDALGVPDLLGNLDSVIGRAHSVADAYHNAHDAVTNTMSGLTDAAAGLGIGSFAGTKGKSLLAGLGEFAEPLGVATGVSGAGDVANSWIQQVQGAHPGLAPWLTPVADITAGIAAPFREMKEGYDWLTGGDKPAPQEDSTDRLYNSVFGGGGGGGSTSTTANEVEVQSSVATISAGTVTLGGSISLPTTGSSVSSGGGHSSPSGIGKAYGSEGGAAASLYGGGGSSTLLDHFASGGILPGDSPGHDNILGYSGGAPVGLEGGEFIVNPQATQANMDLLKAINSSSHFDVGGVLPNQPQQSDPGPGGAPGLPSTGPDFNETNAYGSKKQQQMGTGQGFGLTGGGLIGFAESAPMMALQAGASGAGGMGAGSGAGAAAAIGASLWQNIGQPEVNEAIKSGTQIAAAAAMAPLETMWLGGGQMGAPTVGSPAKAGWTGKLLGSVLGSHFDASNIAGAAQPPKDPQGEKNSGDSGQADPLGGNNGKQNGGKGGGGPTGNRRRPAAREVVGGGSTPPQGSTTSAMAVPSMQSAMP